MEEKKLYINCESNFFYKKDRSYPPISIKRNKEMTLNRQQPPIIEQPFLEKPQENSIFSDIFSSGRHSYISIISDNDTHYFHSEKSYRMAKNKQEKMILPNK